MVLEFATVLYDEEFSNLEVPAVYEDNPAGLNVSLHEYGLSLLSCLKGILVSLILVENNQYGGSSILKVLAYISLAGTKADFANSPALKFIQKYLSESGLM